MGGHLKFSRHDKSRVRERKREEIRSDRQAEARSLKVLKTQMDSFILAKFLWTPTASF